MPGVSNRLPDDLPRMWALSRAFHRSPMSASFGSRLQIGIVGSGRPPLRSTRAEHWQGSSHPRSTQTTRVSHAVFMVVALTLLLVGSRRPPGLVYCMPPKHTWGHSLPVRPSKVTPLSEVLHHRPSPVAPALPAQAALAPGRADGTSVAAYRQGCKRSALGFCQ